MHLLFAQGEADSGHFSSLEYAGTRDSMQQLMASASEHASEWPTNGLLRHAVAGACPHSERSIVTPHLT